jgi:hypothetical protein
MFGVGGRNRDVIARLVYGAWLGLSGGPLFAQAVSPAQAPVPAAAAVGVNLNLTPRRVTLDRASRTATVYAYNQGDSVTTFDVSLVDRVMLPDGQIRSVEQAAKTFDEKTVADRLHSARDLVVVTPRRITLAPGKGQVIRLRATLPDGNPDAPSEYRTHLTVANVPPPDTGLTAEQAAAQQAGQLMFRVRSIVAISIPILVRTAPADARARLEGVRLTTIDAPLEAGAPPRTVAAVAFQIVRVGASSLFGNVEVRGGPRAEESLGLARGVGVYPEIAQRSLQVMLKRAPGPGEKLTILFTDDDSHAGTELARTSFEVP